MNTDNLEGIVDEQAEDLPKYRFSFGRRLTTGALLLWFAKSLMPSLPVEQLIYNPLTKVTATANLEYTACEEKALGQDLYYRLIERNTQKYGSKFTPKERTVKILNGKANEVTADLKERITQHPSGNDDFYKLNFVENWLANIFKIMGPDFFDYYYLSDPRKPIEDELNKEFQSEVVKYCPLYFTSPSALGKLRKSLASEHQVNDYVLCVPKEKPELGLFGEITCDLTEEGRNFLGLNSPSTLSTQIIEPNTEERVQKAEVTLPSYFSRLLGLMERLFIHKRKKESEEVFQPVEQPDFTKDKFETAAIDEAGNQLNLVNLYDQKQVLRPEVKLDLEAFFERFKASQIAASKSNLPGGITSKGPKDGFDLERGHYDYARLICYNGEAIGLVLGRTVTAENIGEITAGYYNKDHLQNLLSTGRWFYGDYILVDKSVGKSGIATKVFDHITDLIEAQGYTGHASRIVDWPQKNVASYSALEKAAQKRGLELERLGETKIKPRDGDGQLVGKGLYGFRFSDNINQG